MRHPMKTEILTPDKIETELSDKRYINMPAAKRYERKKWQIRIDSSFPNINKVHPLQQDKVNAIIKCLSKDHNVRSVTIFGSSVTNRCHIGSDVDVYVELTEDKKLALPAFDFLYDMWTNFSVDTGMLKEIRKKGVKVYDRQ